MTLLDTNEDTKMKKNPDNKGFTIILVGDTGFEPVTSCLSSKRAKPTAPITPNGLVTFT